MPASPTLNCSPEAVTRYIGHRGNAPVTGEHLPEPHAGTRPRYGVSSFDQSKNQGGNVANPHEAGPFPSDPAEQPLAGGFVSDVVLVGETVRKSPPRDPDFVRRLLRHFEQHQWTGAPRFLGTDHQGREMLSFIDGEVPWLQSHAPPSIRSEQSLAAVARQVRRFHDLTAGTDLAGGHEVVCHNDLSPRNTVYRGTARQILPVAFIDWDIAAPGARVHDVAHVCWQYVGLGPAVQNAPTAAKLVRVIADAYGLEDRSVLVDTIMWWQDRCWRGIEAAAEAGEPAMIRLRDSGAAEAVHTAYDWTQDHHDLLHRAVTPT